MDAPDLPDLLDALDPHADRATRNLWLRAVLAWIRGQRAAQRHPAAAAGRVRLLLDAIQARPDWQARWQCWWSEFVGSTDMAPFLADYGFAPRTAFASDLGHRIRRKLLPQTPDTHDLAELFDLLMPTLSAPHWLSELDDTTLDRLGTLLFPIQTGAPGGAPAGVMAHPWSAALLDALMFSVSQVAATGFSAEIRLRIDAQVRAGRPFHQLLPCFETYRHTVTLTGARSPASLQAAGALRTQLEQCRQAAQTVYTHLDEHGISVGIVFRLRQLRERILRIRTLMDCLHSEQPARATTQLLALLVRVGLDSRSIRALVASSAHLTAAKVAERSAETGEHYITRSVAQYRHMLGTAAGGGAVIGFTTWGKFALYALALSPFWAGLAAGLNYAASFVLVMLLHWTVATKQPAVTAPAMAAKLKDMSQPHSVDHFVDEVAHLIRSQMAAIVGNLGAVVPVVLALCALLTWSGQGPMIDEAAARHVLHDLHLLGPTPLFAAFTGVLLFASSIVAGWVENAFVFHRLDSALTHHPRATRWLGVERAARWGVYWRQHISGYAANISLGLMLGLVPAVATFFGLGLEVRHVTLSTGQVAAAAWTLGLESLRTPAFWWAVTSLAVIGPLNLGVSFYCAFRLALAAHNVTGLDRQRIRRAIGLRLRAAPRSFFLPARAAPTPDSK
jgi:site-specific recombinase